MTLECPEEETTLTNKKKSSPTWTDLKAKLAELDQKQLIQHIGDLYRLSRDNQEFLNARFGFLEDPLAPFVKSIHEYMYPEISNNKPVQISKAKAVIRKYANATRDFLLEIELKIVFIECGNRFTLEYGDMDEGFYDSLVLMYKNVLGNILRFPEANRRDFKNRLKKIMESSSGMGWGYHDALREDYYHAFPED